LEWPVSKLLGSADGLRRTRARGGEMNNARTISCTDWTKAARSRAIGKIDLAKKDGLGGYGGGAFDQDVP